MLMDSKGHRKLSASDVRVIVELSEVYSYRHVGKMMGGVSAQWISEIVHNASHFLVGNNLSTSIFQASSIILPMEMVTV